ncbi:hypothetical protein NGA_2106200, partial [Nannochloropsis gaditana CCMP526]|uniref:uncharacterized protein n=1 Tax=Nannochloropsis gaditana (strain CCMP526) TaxID=1093141 RepID=UPI00029F561B
GPPPCPKSLPQSIYRPTRPCFPPSKRIELVGRLLLRDAVDVAPPPKKIPRADAYHAPLWVQELEELYGLLVLGIHELRYDDSLVGYVEVHVRGRHAPAHLASNDARVSLFVRALPPFLPPFLLPSLL